MNRDATSAPESNTPPRSVDAAPVKPVPERVSEVGPAAPRAPCPSLTDLSALRHARVLLVDDEPEVLRSMQRSLRARGYQVETAMSGTQAVASVDDRKFDVVVSDISMPGMTGIQLLRNIRDRDLHVPVVLITGEPTVGTAVQALEYGALHYLTKPVSLDAIDRVIHKAARMHRLSRIRQQAAELLGHPDAASNDRATLEANFERALEQLWIAYQPIVDFGARTVFGYEALMRTRESSLPHPGAMLDAAERLDTLDVLGRAIRNQAAIPFGLDGQVKAPPQARLFVNLHVTDLLDDWLVSPEAPLTQIADRVVLELTERASLSRVPDARGRIAQLREIGFKIAVDDMGAGYAGLSSFAALEPEFVKLDMSLIRDIHLNPVKQKVVGSMARLSMDMGMFVVAEGVECVEERDVLLALDCNLLQGYFFAKPANPLPEVQW